MSQPDSPGLWIFEGHIAYVKSSVIWRLARQVVRVYFGTISQRYYVQHGRAIHPVSMLIGAWHRIVE